MINETISNTSVYNIIYELLEHEYSKYMFKDNNVVALCLTGSNGIHVASTNSDIDLILFVDNIQTVNPIPDYRFLYKDKIHIHYYIRNIKDMLTYTKSSNTTICGIMLDNMLYKNNENIIYLNNEKLDIWNKFLNNTNIVQYFYINEYKKRMYRKIVKSINNNSIYHNRFIIEFYDIYNIAKYLDSYNIMKIENFRKFKDITNKYNYELYFKEYKINNDIPEDLTNEDLNNEVINILKTFKEYLDSLVIDDAVLIDMWNKIFNNN